MRISNSLLFKKTKAYQTLINSQKRSPVFFLDHLNKLGLLPNVKGIIKDLDFTKNTHLLLSIDVRVLSKSRLDFLMGTFNNVKFRESGLKKASILSIFSLRGKLQFNTQGLSGFDGSPALLLNYGDYASALRPFPELSREDFTDEDEFKEWAILVQAFSPVLISFGGYLFPFEFFKKKFSGLACSPQHLPIHLLRDASVRVSHLFGSSFSEFSKINGKAVSSALVLPLAASSVFRGLFSSLIFRRSCQL